MTEETLPSTEPTEGDESKAPSRSDEITITFHRAHLFVILMPLTFLLGIGLGYLLWGRAPTVTGAQASGTGGPAAEASAVSQEEVGAPTAVPLVTRYDVPVDDDPALGPADAPITIVEFSDFECPFCQKWNAEVFGKIKEQYSDQVRIVYRDFPLESIHANAFPAAEAANCANEQGAFWPYHDKLFSMEKGLSQQAYTQYASDLGLNLDDFSACLESGKYKQEVQADFDFAANLGVRSTPTFFINGIALVGAQPFEVFQEVIEKELAGEIPQ
jgi:protein-disulfide isomerase